MNKSKKGFTLIELIVVLAILAVLAAIAVPTAFGSIERARQSADRASVDGYNSAIRMQAAILAADPEGTTAAAGNTFAAAITASGIVQTTMAQSTTGITVTWVPPVASGVAGHFIYSTTGTPNLVKAGGTVFSQLQTAAGGATAPIIA